MATDSTGKTPKHMTDFIILLVEICAISRHSFVRLIKLGLWSSLSSQVRPSPEFPGLHEHLTFGIVENSISTAFLRSLKTYVESDMIASQFWSSSPAKSQLRVDKCVSL